MSNLIRKNSNARKAVTSKDVARLAGVSQPTVSRVFNPSNAAAVAEDARERVLKAAAELGYRRNFIASAVSSGITNIVGVVVGFGVGPFYKEVQSSLITEIQKAGKKCLIFKVEEQKMLDELIENVLQFQVDAIVVLSPAISKASIASCVNRQTPIILFNRHMSNVDAHCVYCDNLVGGMIAGEYIASRGHRNIAYIGYIDEVSSEIKRHDGFLAKLSDYDIYDVMEEFSEYSYESGCMAARKLFKKYNKPTAVFCTSDLIAMGVMDVARYEFGLRVPEDISVVGFDDIPMSSWAAYSLTTVRQPIDKMIEATVDIIKQTKYNSELPRQSIRIPLEIVERKTVISK